MLCEHCQQEEAVVSYTLKIGDQEREMHLCQSCLEKLMTEDLGIKKSLDEGFGGILESMLQMMAGPRESQEEELECPHCHSTWQDFKDSGRLGCRDCYEFFGEELENIIGQFHGHSLHRGEMPSHLEEEVYKDRKVLDLKEDLAKAVEKEDYERAAVLRDEIKSLREENHESN